MRRRILVLAGYFGRNLFFSLAGSIYLILALAYWRIFFDPGQSTPHAEYYILVIGAFGAAITFLSALTVTARANQMANYPLVVRLPSRIEYLTAVFLSTLFFGTLLQLLIAALALLNGPAISLGRALEIPPIWLAFNILASVLALHASDFVAAGWSRVYIFGILAVFLFGQSTNDTASKWLAARISNLSLVLFEEGFSSEQWIEQPGQLAEPEWIGLFEPGVQPSFLAL
jgi:hypothetical protein